MEYSYLLLLPQQIQFLHYNDEMYENSYLYTFIFIYVYLSRKGDERRSKTVSSLIHLLFSTSNLS